MPPFKRSAVKRNTSTRRQAATSRAAQADLFTSDHRERLHPPSHKATVDKQARLLWSLVKMSRLHCITPWQGRKPSVLSEELLLAQKREEKTYVFVPPFFCKKNGGRRGIRTLGELPLGGFQDRCLKPLDHSSAMIYLI